MGRGLPPPGGSAKGQVSGVASRTAEWQLPRDSNGDALVLVTIGRYLVTLPGVGHQSAQGLFDELAGTELADLVTLPAFEWPNRMELLLDQPSDSLAP